MLYNRIRTFGALILIGLFSAVSSVHGETGPMDVIKSGTQRVLNILNTCKPGETLTVAEYRAELEKIVDEYFDFDEMSIRVLGRHVRSFTPEQRSEFRDLFRELLFETYIDRYETYTCGGNEEVIYEGEVIREPYALVKTVVRGYKDTDVVVEYRLKKKPEGWKVYDVVVEGVSLIQNYRSQFNDILVRESSEQLLQRLRQKVNKG
ncbi:MlaC/ttg2D family ABC transporter substrate-binding protein [Thermodesulforhabdus norvegica]|uniref:Phospholipid transport system substrate-binding protein n=1 Tax=Thermodesulforhabdus norvegica TaxID=39841 RepID=A0A1I4VEJ7_9BACT|nr:ABC transporter substrate-binding protein [Thermodesulforhabdus norvegica]SFM99612.1 phospholipid transport system substrate-binding protein [Thermodesulforhabdus norvegica]